MSGNEQKKDLTVREAGKRGGDECAQKHGPGFYEEIGKRGGTRTRDKYGQEFYAEIGKAGGAATAAKHGPEFYARIGKLGGSRVRQLIQKAKDLEANAGGDQ